MTLWTVQSLEWYNELLKNGKISGAKEHIGTDWKFGLYGYHWLMKKMDEKIGKRPFPECYPVWAWYQYGNCKKRKPDLRGTVFFPKGTKGVRLEIQKKTNEVLLSDFMLWHFPFSYQSFIGKNQTESEAFDSMLEQKQLDNTNLGKLPKDLRHKIIESWDRILDMDFDEPYFTNPKNTKSIQATFWTLSLDEVVNVDRFVAR